MKAGIDYFPLDCQPDEKLELIEAEFGHTGFSVVIKLLQRIYGGQGYYCEWTKEVALLFAKRAGLSGSNVVSEITAAAVRRGIFHAGLFETYHILTSAAIQRQYLEAAGRRKKVTLQAEYILLAPSELPKNVDIQGENADRFSTNSDILRQRKGEKSKEKQSKEQESTSAPAADSLYAAYDPFGNIRLSSADYEALCKRFGKQNTHRYIERMSRYQQEHDRSYSDHLQKLTEWMEKDQISASSYDLEALKALRNRI